MEIPDMKPSFAGDFPGEFPRKEGGAGMGRERRDATKRDTSG